MIWSSDAVLEGRTISLPSPLLFLEAPCEQGQTCSGGEVKRAKLVAKLGPLL